MMLYFSWKKEAIVLTAATMSTYEDLKRMIYDCTSVCFCMGIDLIFSCL